MINPSLAGAMPNDTWITEGDVSDPEVLPEIPGITFWCALSLLRQKPKEELFSQKEPEMISPTSPRWGVYSKLERLPTKTKISFLQDRGVELETMFVIKS